MTKDTRDKVNEALLLTKTLTEKHERLDPIHAEFATAFACLCRAKRLLEEREAEAEVSA